jgi:hypothetical protein
MSFSKTIQTAVDDVIKTYIDNISNKYNINKIELLKLWSGDNLINTETSSERKDIQPKVVNNSALNSLTKPELVELCKIKKLKYSGTKAQLIENLTKAENNNSDKPLKNSVSETKVNSPQQPIVKKLVAKIPNISIKRNKFDNYEHAETTFVFNNKEKKVYGKQNVDGTISPLTKDDIDLCNKYKFAYYIPDNLDKKTNLNDIDLEELKDDEEELDEELEEDEEELEDDDVEEDVEEEEFEEEYYEE